MTEDLRHSQSSKVGEAPSGTQDRKIKCNCHKNGCTKGYCDCLKNGLPCDPLKCGCIDCVNTIENKDLRESLKSKQQTKLSAEKGDGCSCKHS